MSIPSATELGYLRTRPHQSKLYLSIYQPEILFACQATGSSLGKGSREIDYYNVTQGNFSSIEDGMVLLVGTTPNGNEKGRIRVRSANASQMTVAENSHILWASGDYLTALNFIEINPVYQRIDVDTDVDPVVTTFYMDYDIPYVNQNSELGTFICMGCNHAKFIDDGGGLIYYSSTGSYNLKGDAVSYHWYFQGADVTGSNLAIPGWVHYSTPGQYVTRLIVSGSSYADASYRYISIYNRPENSASNNPILKWELLDMLGSRENGGYTARIRIYDTIPRTVVRDGALVVLFSENWYGDTKYNLGGNAYNRGSIFFSGYILDGTITYNYEYSAIEFTVGSATEIMKSVTGSIATGLTSSADPLNDPGIAEKGYHPWVFILDADVKRYIYHYYRWHSTVLKCCDFQFIHASDFKVQYGPTDATSIYDFVNSYMDQVLGGKLVCDRQGKLWAEAEVSLHGGWSGLGIETNMVLDKHDWMGEPIIEEITSPILSGIEVGGIAYSGPSTGTFAAYLSQAPGVALNYRGTFSRGEYPGLAVNDQTQLNYYSGNIYAAKNTRFPSVVYDIVGNYRNFDIAPQEYIPIVMDANDNVRGITFNGERFTIQEMSWYYDSELSYLYPSIIVSEVTAGTPGDTIEIGDEPPMGGYDNPPFEFPPFPWMPDCPPGILLYDEGVYLGRVTSLDFLNCGVSITGSVGTVEFYCGEPIRAIGLLAQGETENIDGGLYFGYSAIAPFGITDIDNRYLTYYQSSGTVPFRAEFIGESGNYSIEYHVLGALGAELTHYAGDGSLKANYTAAVYGGNNNPEPGLGYTWIDKRDIVAEISDYLTFKISSIEGSYGAAGFHVFSLWRLSP